MKSAKKRFQVDWYIAALLFLFVPLFFFRMHWPNLGSWDEAWYGSIAREMAKSGDFMHSNWNGTPFYDHPPMGFWIMALTYMVFGISEFTTRLPSVVMGIFSIVLVYLTGYELFKKRAVGFAAALILGTSVWYVIRVRSGNLDSPFVFFYILTIFLALKSVKNIKLFPLVGLTFGSLMMTKTLVGISALPVIGIIMLPQIWKIKKNMLWLLGGIVTFGIVVLPWYIIHIQTYPDFIQHHFLEIGTRNKTASSYFILNYELPLFYLHMGIRKWYYLWIVAIGGLIVTLRFIKRNAFVVFFWNAVVLYPFLTTDKTHIWHLIPVYVPLSLVTAYGLWELGNVSISIMKKISITPLQKPIKKFISEKVITTVYLLVFVSIAAMQMNVFYKEVIPNSRYVTDDVAVAKAAGKYDQKMYLDDDFLPMAVFYSDNFMTQMSFQPENKRTLVNLFKSKEKNFVVITRIWALQNLEAEGIEYRILEENNSFAIVTRP